MFSGPVYFELQRSPGNYIGAESNGDGTYDAIITPDGQKFNMIYPGLTNRLGTCSFESYSYPGYFLRHYNNELMMEKVDDPRFSPGSTAPDASSNSLVLSMALSFLQTQSTMTQRSASAKTFGSKTRSRSTRSTRSPRRASAARTADWSSKNTKTTTSTEPKPASIVRS